MLGIEFLPLERVVEIRLSYYPDAAGASRIEARIRLEGVRQFNQIADVEQLVQNHSAGNIVYWMPSKGAGKTFVHLANGLLEIDAASVRLIADG